MSRPEKPVDKFGFPIPAQFGDDPRRLPDEVALTTRKRRRAIVIGLIGLFGLGLVAPWVWVMGQGWYTESLILKAHEQYADNDLPTALSTLSKALDRLSDDAPDRTDLILLRAAWRLKAEDLTGALEDANRALQDSKVYARGYRLRAQIYRRLERNDEMMADVDKAFDLSPREGLEGADAFNFRGYMRALAERDLPSALVDAEQADTLFTEAAKRMPRVKLYDSGAIKDTLGYVQHLVGKNDDALVSMNQAIELARTYRRRVEAEPSLQKQPTRQNLALRENDEHLAVMYHHRALVHAARGENNKSQQDREDAERLGYNPAKGVE